MEAIAMPIDWADFPEPGARRLPGLPLTTRANRWCWNRTSSSRPFCRAPSSASSATRRWTTTANRSATPAKIGGRRCRGRATFRSKASRPTSSRSSRSYSRWLAKSDVPKLFINGEPGAIDPRPRPRLRPHLAEPDRSLGARVALHPGGQPRRNRCGRRVVRSRGARGQLGPGLEDKVERSLRGATELREAAAVDHHFREPGLTRLGPECRTVLGE